MFIPFYLKPHFILLFLLNLPCFPCISVMCSPNICLTNIHTHVQHELLCSAKVHATVFCGITSLLKLEENAELEESWVYQKSELFTYLFLPVFSWRGLQWERGAVMEFTPRKTQE